MFRLPTANYFLKLCKKDGCLVFISEYELHKFSEAGKF